jgi:hypothetical protein
VTAAPVWHESNQRGLCRELDRVYDAIVRFSGGTPEERPHAEGEPSALDHVARVFGLSPFERDVLLLCAGVELESRFGQACAAAQNDSRLISPTFSLALGALANPHWSAVNRDGALRYWRLIEIGQGSLVRSPLRIDEQILHFIAGVDCFDDRLEPFMHAVAEATDSVPQAHDACAAKGAAYWRAGGGLQPILLTGRRMSELRTVCRETCRQLGRPLWAMRATDVPGAAAEREQLARLWNREALLGSAVLTIEARDTDIVDVGRVGAFLERLQVPVAVEVREGSAAEQLPGMHIHVPPLGARDRKGMWMESLGDASSTVNGNLDRVAECFDLDASTIRLASDLVRMSAREGDVSREVWRTCRTLSRRSLDGLAQRVEIKAAWDDLVLPDLQIETLRQIVAHVRQRSVVHGEWGFAERYARGLGVTALFAGASGTGKTMSAEVIAAELDLDLYQIDLAGVVSKYIGETEKNLRRIFDAAEDGGAVLLFDEADAIFGKRSEVKDSHDRYANLEVSYLLQRMEMYRGLAILTTNMKQALDTAFLRRIRFIVQFPFPGPEERRRIWERVFPLAAPVGAVDYAMASKLNVPGGVIRNIATHAAFLAADQGTPIGMSHILSAARVEYAKLDRPLTPAETGGWA